MRKEAGTSGREAQDLQPVRQRRGITQQPAILRVVVDGMIVEADGLESREIGLVDGARGQVEDFSHFKFVEAAQGHDAMFTQVHSANWRDLPWPSQMLCQMP